MQRVTRRRPLFLLIAALAAVGTTGSQCARVDDRVTGPRSDDPAAAGGTGGAAACVQACNEIGRQARDGENELHHDNIRACQELTGDARSQCLEDEGVRHSARMEQIAADQEACKSPCHEQGSGSGGQ